jgi:hypothetical protein
MTGGRRMAWRLAGSGGLALLLAAGCAALAPDSSRKAGMAATSGTAPAASGTPAAPPTLPSGPAARSAGGPVLAIVGDPGRVLVQLDPRSLRPLPGRRLVLTDTVAGYAWSPDRSTLVLGDNDQDALYLVDARRMRALGKVWLDAPNAPQWFGWLGPRRLLAVVDQPLGDPAAELGDAAVVLVDPLAGRVLHRQNLHSRVHTVVSLGDQVVLLTTPVDGIGTAGLAVVDDQGKVRTAPLRAISAGFEEPAEHDADSVTERREAGLAVDRAGGRAFVVAAGTPVAEVDLATLRVAYHGLSQPASFLRRLAGWFVPAAEAKLASGPLRSACWLGDGLLAVWGSDARVVRDAGAEPKGGGDAERPEAGRHPPLDGPAGPPGGDRRAVERRQAARLRRALVPAGASRRDRSHRLRARGPPAAAALQEPPRPRGARERGPRLRGQLGGRLPEERGGGGGPARRPRAHDRSGHSAVPPARRGPHGLLEKRQALFSAALGLVEVFSDEDVVEVVSAAGFLSRLSAAAGSVLAGLPRESVR